ncbi:MAG: glycosyltransferase [Marinilabiliaceae bacterium]
MKVLHINQSDSTGGAAIAAIRLLDALRAGGSDARMLVLRSEGRHPGVTSLVRTRGQKFRRDLKFLAEVFSYVPYEKNKKQRFTFSSGRFGYDLSRHPLVREADILHLHWINQGMLSLHGLQKLLWLGKPIVWTLHDTWPFTGGCHYPGACSGFTVTCGQCPLLKSPGERDLSARQHKMKEAIYENASMTFVGCSKWIKEMAEKSSLVKKDLKHTVEHVFNPVDTSLFAPASDKRLVRQELGLPVDKKLVLFGAANAKDPRKGADLLMRSLRNLSHTHPGLKNQLELVAFGKNASAFEALLPFRLHSFHVVHSQEKMARLYQAADMFVLPSQQDNLPNTVVESLSCGTPVVAFGIGGVPEMVRHGQTGYLAEVGKWRELGNGVISLLEDSRQYGTFARDFALQNFDPAIVAAQYQGIYDKVLSGENL